MTSLGICLAVLSTTCWRTERGEASWGGGVHGLVICWIIICGLRPVGGRKAISGCNSLGEEGGTCNAFWGRERGMTVW